LLRFSDVEFPASVEGLIPFFLLVAFFFRTPDVLGQRFHGVRVLFSGRPGGGSLFFL